MLDVSFHVTQYQNIIAELKGEIDRLKDKINIEEVCDYWILNICWKQVIIFQNDKSSPATKQQIEELKLLRDALVANFKEQMKLRYNLTQ